jgi:ferric-dicitrate binding protein FerR (iron transport regulator)
MAMKMNEESWKAEIIKLYIKSRFSKSTEAKVQKWLVKNSDDEEVDKAMRAHWESIKPTRQSFTLDVLKRINSKIGKPAARRRVVWRSAVVRIAAVFIMLMAISSVWLYLHHQNKRVFIQVAAAYGETKQITLPDQSEIWLNSGSTLKYPEDFNQNERFVSLTGEAYFSVAKDSMKPFVVNANDIKVRVLGTKFNIKAYPEDRQIVATLQEGKIEVVTADNVKQQLLPNEQLVYNNQTAALQVERINPEYIPDWKNGRLLFFEETLDDILQTLSRRFNVAFRVDESIDLTTERYTMKFQKDEDLDQVLWVLSELTIDLSFKQTNGNVVVERNN